MLLSCSEVYINDQGPWQEVGKGRGGGGFFSQNLYNFYFFDLTGEGFNPPPAYGHPLLKHGRP